MTIDEAIARLQSGKGSIRCAEILRILDAFGFAYRQGSRGRHYVVKHHQLTSHGFDGWSFNGKNPTPIAYVSQLKRLLEEYREILRELGYE